MSDASDQRVVQQELASRVLARRRLIHFIKRLDGKYMAGWVHEDICKRLERFSDEVAKGLSPRLMLLMPPRHGKSRIASISFPAWHLGRNPDHEFIASSYNVALAMTFSRKCQAVMNDPRYPFDQVKLDPNNQSAETWGLTNNGMVSAGGYVSAGVGGGITGKGAHILTIDDPIKNHEEADSQLVREGLWDWYTSTAYTRLAPGGGVLVIQTCWHDDDLAGRLQQAMKGFGDDPDVDQFEIVKYPAIAEADEWIDPVTDVITRIETKREVLREHIADPAVWSVIRVDHVRDATAELQKQQPGHVPMTLLRVKGEPLHPARYDIPKLLRIKRVLPNRFWSALYQQNPVPDDGSFFTRTMFKQAPVPDKFACNVFMTWDFAIKEKQHNDWTVGRVAYQDQDDLLHMVDLVRFKSGDAFFIVDSIITMMKTHKTQNFRAGFEDGQIFSSIEALLKRRMREERLFIPYDLLTPVTDKQVRASPLQGRMQQGRVSYKAGAEWYDTTKHEYLRFPNGTNDDIVDTDAWMARLVAKFEPPKPKKQKKMRSWKDKLPRSGARYGGPQSA